MRVARSRDYWPGLALALLAGIHKAALASTVSNDDYMHLAYARQLLHGDLPLRDFWDLSTTLQVLLSALSQLIFGHRLLAEAVLVGVFTALTVFIVFRTVQSVTGSSFLAVLGAVLLVVATPRAFGYPKWIVYAVAAWWWWQYVWWPSAQRAVIAGAWIGVAFYWRHDHGVLVATGVVLCMAAAHGFTRLAVQRTAIAAATALAVVMPYLVFAQVEPGLLNLARVELASFRDEQGRTRAIALRAPFRGLADFVQVGPSEPYAPLLTVRWRPDARLEARAAALQKYGLSVVEGADSNVQRVRLSPQSLDSLRALIDDPLIDDTGGVERGPGTFTRTQWPLIDRLRFRNAWLRLEVLPGLDQADAAGSAAALFLLGIPLVGLALCIPPLSRRLPPAVSPRAFVLFTAYAIVVNVVLLREPYQARAPEVIVLPTIVLAVVLSALRREGLPILPRWALRIAATAILFFGMKSLAVAGEFSQRSAWLLGGGKSLVLARTAWQDVSARLAASPPSNFAVGRHQTASVRLSAYVRRCVSPGDRVLVLWFAPEIYFDADRLMASRHGYYFPTFGALADEQRRELDKVTRAAPPIVLAHQGSFEDVGKAFPAMIRYVNAHYAEAAAFDDAGYSYRILTRTDTPPRSRDRETGWPCYS